MLIKPGDTIPFFQCVERMSDQVSKHCIYCIHRTTVDICGCIHAGPPRRPMTPGVSRQFSTQTSRSRVKTQPPTRIFSRPRVQVTGAWMHMINTYHRRSLYEARSLNLTRASMRPLPLSQHCLVQFAMTVTGRGRIFSKLILP